MKTKAVSYAYPSSPFANRFGFSKTGCYVVETLEGHNPPKGVSGHASPIQALVTADGIDLPWSRYSLFQPSPLS